MNPCTLGWYLPLLVKDAPGALQPSDGDRPGEHPPPAPGSIGGARPEEGFVPNPATSSSRHSRAPISRHDAPSAAPAPPAPALAPAPGSSALVADADAPRPPQRERGQHELVWRELDAKFRRDLPDEAYIGRLAYRGLVMRACPRIVMLDGVEVERKERDKAERLLRSIFGNGKSGDASREVAAS